MLCVRLTDTVQPGLNLRSFLVALVTGNVNSLSDLSVCVLSRRSTARFHSCARRQIGPTVHNLFVGLRITGFLCAELVLQPIQAQ